MKKYAKITNHETGAVSYFAGDPEKIFRKETLIIEEPSAENPQGKTEEKIIYMKDYCQAQGMSLMDIEQGPDGLWYVAGKTPPAPVTKVVRTFAKDAIWVATKDMTLPDGSNAWSSFKLFLEQAQLKEGWDQQAYLLEENPFFEIFYPQAVSVFGAETVDAVLAAAVVDKKIITVQ